MPQKIPEFFIVDSERIGFGPGELISSVYTKIMKVV